MVGDLFEPLVGDAAPARDVAQERDDVVLPLGPAEAGEQDRVVGDRDLDVRRTGCRGIRRERHRTGLVEAVRDMPLALLSLTRPS